MRWAFAFSVWCAVACSSCRSSSDAGTSASLDASFAAPSTSVAFSDASSAAHDAGLPDPIAGEWERRTEPYKGMRIAIVGNGSTRRAIVTAAPAVTEDRLEERTRSAGRVMAKAQLECQRSLWRTGEEFLSAVRSTREHELAGTIVVRDWGFTGTCRHADSRAPARLSLSGAGELTITVTRGKDATQVWVRPAP